MNQDIHYRLQDMLEFNELDVLKEYGYTWTDPYDIIFLFEKQLAKYTGAPYVVTTDCCTHAMELCFRWLDSIGEMPSKVDIPKYTYLSVPMMLHKLGIKYVFDDRSWLGEYRFKNVNIYDSARMFVPDMFSECNAFKCLSFGVGKPLQIGRGGAILVDNREAYLWLSRARSDGRDLTIKPWSQDTFNFIGYHYNMTVEQAAKGIILLDSYEANFDFFEDVRMLYPDLTKCPIKVDQ
jgi:dTDP-4-amino-4,6-dideoxygalactose transaminase